MAKVFLSFHSSINLLRWDNVLFLHVEQCFFVENEQRYKDDTVVLGNTCILYMH